MDRISVRVVCVLSAAFVLSGAASLLFGTLWPFGTVVAVAFIAFTILGFVEMIKNG
jgi:hypothetical protein